MNGHSHAKTTTKKHKDVGNWSHWTLLVRVWDHVKSNHSYGERERDRETHTERKEFIEGQALPVAG